MHAPARLDAAAASAATPLVELRGVRKTYGLGTAVATEVLHGVDLSVARGEFVALIGPSGSGKSTLLNIIGLLETMSSGEYRLLGQPVGELGDAELTRRRGDTLGFVFQFHHLLPAFSALENVLMPELIRGGRVGDAARARAMALLEKVGLAAAAHKRPAELSGGMQQRVAIARALAHGCPLVLADEPTGNLDTHSADEVFALMRRMNVEARTAFLIVTHDPRLAARCDRVIELVDGLVANRVP
ncbi:MAG TPA: ABC transporter ATP-binding protein [Rubrivivax sp.]|nr:ABC transporter ATP-binding protein [Burkholderiales bacterium]HNT40004.1 ABC transporter ATP-binding protein [Rubrivivax sp.]